LITGEYGACALVYASFTKIENQEGKVWVAMDEFYSALCSTLRESVKAFVDREKKKVLYKVFLDLNCSFEGEILRFARYIKLITNGCVVFEDKSERRAVIVDDKCLKILKSSKKQRFIPSRKGENIKN